MSEEVLRAEAPDYPEWFQAALDTPSEQHEILVDGCPINYVTWGDIGKPGIVLMHGSNAHLEWWRMIAPFLAHHFRVAAMDFSGAGNSGWREAYSGASFAKEAMCVAEAACLGDAPYVVGHSFGGFIALETAYLYGERLGGVIAMDATIQSPAQADEYAEFREQRRQQPVRPTRVYPDRASALARFRLMPEQPCKNSFLVDYVGQQAIREVEGGWTWKFDPGMFKNLTMEYEGGPSRTEKFLGLKCLSAFIMAENSSDYSAGSLDYTRQLTEGSIPLLTVPGTFHHLMFDEPVAVAMAIKSMLLAWQFR